MLHPYIHTKVSRELDFFPNLFGLSCGHKALTTHMGREGTTVMPTPSSLGVFTFLSSSLNSHVQLLTFLYFHHKIL